MKEETLNNITTQENDIKTTEIPSIKEQLEGKDIDDFTKEELKEKKFIVEITDHAAKGLSVTRISGKVTFIPYATVGDIVEIGIKKVKSKYMNGYITRIIKPSEHRIAQKCEVFTQCGGCWFQHLTYEKELEIKKNTLMKTLRVIAHLEPPVMDVIPSPTRDNYRNHIQIKSSMLRDLGFFMPEKIRVVPLPEGGCRIIPKEMNNYLNEINTNKKTQIPIHHTFRIRQDCDNNIHSSGFDDIDNPKYIYDKVGKYTYRIGFHNFFQVNRYQIENWLNVIKDFVGSGHNKILDIYCGVGLISLHLSDRAKKVIGIEINPKSIEDAIYSAKENNVNNVEFIASDSSKGLLEIDSADVVVLDPPRSGCDKKALSSIVRISPEKIVYVSCDPATFSRDCRILTDSGYELIKVQPVDMFPYTYHVEIVGLLVKNDV